MDYAIAHSVDTVEVIVNDAWEAQDTAWSVAENKGYFNGAVMRILDVYNANTQYDDLNIGQLLAKLHGVIVKLNSTSEAKDLTIIIYSMPYPLAATYRDELGFDQTKMLELLNEGVDFIMNGKYDVITRQVYTATKL